MTGVNGEAEQVIMSTALLKLRRPRRAKAPLQIPSIQQIIFPLHLYKPNNKSARPFINASGQPCPYVVFSRTAVLAINLTANPDEAVVIRIDD
jgi:hypothetical protein